MNLYEEYLKRAEKKSPSKEASILFGVFNILEGEKLIDPNWDKKKPEEKNKVMEEILSFFPIWEKNFSSVD